MFKGFIHVAEDDFPRMYNLSWRDDGADCFIIFEISRDAIGIVTEKLKDNSWVIEREKKDLSSSKFGDDLNSQRYGFDDCAIVNQLKDGSIELIFKLVTIDSEQSEHYIFACAATIHVLADSLMSIPEEEIEDSLPQFMTISTVCCKNRRGGHGGHITGEFNKDVKRYLMHHYEKKGEILRPVLNAMLKAAAKMGSKREDKLIKSLYWAKVKGDDGFLSITCPGNACGLNTKETDEAFSFLRNGKRKEDFGMDLICHNVDTIGQQLILIAALAALSDETEKHYLQSRK